VSGLGLVLLLLVGGTVLAAVVLFMLRDERAPSGAAFLAKKNAATELAAEASP